MSPDDIKILRQGNEMIQKEYLGLNDTKHRAKRFGLATWILGWGVYSNAQNLCPLKRISRHTMTKIFSKRSK